MAEWLLWLYLANSVLLINHEIDSAYWKEWELFKLPGGITGFLLVHFLILVVILWGLILVSRGSQWGFVFSFLLCAAGIFAFLIHTYFLRKGRTEFSNPISKWILGAMLLVSALQLAITLYAIA